MLREGGPLRDINNTYNTRSFKGGEKLLSVKQHALKERWHRRPGLSQMLREKEVALLVAKRLQPMGP